ncbi:MAG: SGNH/GDSL hydrolase family protein [Thermodesulfobacteriota bacterium]|nr:SGNH/GDSL hydrolase family protein [Thermodesulfobacteriota bacterium]
MNNKKLFPALLALCLVIFLETASFLALKYSSSLRFHPLNVDSLSLKHKKSLSLLLDGKTKLTDFSCDYGWTTKPNCSGQLYQTNSIGLRNNQEFDYKSQNKIRISTFGDSFTFGAEVSNKDTWQERICDRINNIEILNFAVSAFGLDQSFLRFIKEGIKYDSDIILIGFLSENIFRNVSVYRPFYRPDTGLPLTKPRFTLDKSGDLKLIPNPMTQLKQYTDLYANTKHLLKNFGANDYYYHHRYFGSKLDFFYSVKIFKITLHQAKNHFDGNQIIINGFYNQSSEAYEITTKLFDKFVQTSIENDSLPIILIFPGKSDFKRYNKAQSRIYGPLLDYFISNKFLYLDLLDAFLNEMNNYKYLEFFADSHYSPLGNQIVANYITDFLQSNGLTNSN